MELANRLFILDEEDNTWYDTEYKYRIQRGGYNFKVYYGGFDNKVGGFWGFKEIEIGIILHERKLKIDKIKKRICGNQVI